MVRAGDKQVCRVCGRDFIARGRDGGTGCYICLDCTNEDYRLRRKAPGYRKVRLERRFARISKNPEPYKKRFMVKVLVTDQCWTWTGKRNVQGYGETGFESAHRLAYRIFVGTIPKGLQVLHKCDNPPCVRPDHLFIGTQKDNMQDSKAKGRHADFRGEKHPIAKLTEEQVRYIRQFKGQRKYKELAERFAVSYSLIEKVARGVAWTHV